MALERSKSVPSLRQERPDISWGLESIARKCLAPEPARRYQQADHLADDLRRLLEDRPLKHAPELSRVEQARKFVRRHPRLTSSGTVAGIAALVHAGGRLGPRGRPQPTGRHTGAGPGPRPRRRYPAGALPGQHASRSAGPPARRDRGLRANARPLRGAGRPGVGPAARPGSGSTRRIAGGWRKTGASCSCSWPRPASAWPTGSRDSVGQALVLLDRAESIPGLPPSRALWLDRARYYSLRGETERADSARRRAEQTPATTARDHYLLATSIARQGGPEALKAAITELDEALRRNPRHYWSLVQRGICRLERGELVEAAADFGQCTGIWPEFAWGYFNRGCVLDRTGNKAAAILDFTAALDRDPDLVPAYVNRGLARLELKQYAPALADFDQARALGARDASVSAGRGVALEGLGRHREADAAFADCFARADGPARLDPRATGLGLWFCHLRPGPRQGTRGLRRRACATTRATSRHSTVAPCSP